MGYRNDLLSSRSIIRHGSYALISPEGLVNNVIPFFEKCNISVVASPKLGASFVQYIVTMEPEGRNTKPFGGNGIETFAYVIEGKLEARIGDETYSLEKGGYIFCPPSLGLTLENNSAENVKFVLYKQRYVPVDGVKEPWIVCDNINNLEAELYEDMADVKLTKLFPEDISFDMSFLILTFEPGGSHPFIETHVQEHGAYLLSGEGMYNLDNNWVSVKKDDFIWMGPYVQQATYAVGQEPLSYVYSKDCNRDPEI